MKVLVNTCPVCRRTITQPSTGRRRVFCSPRCRQAAHRARRRELFAVLVGGGGADLAGTPPDLPPNGDDATLETLAHAREVVARFARCATVARPQLSWRCERAATELAGVLDRYFAGPR